MLACKVRQLFRTGLPDLLLIQKHGSQSGSRAGVNLLQQRLTQLFGVLCQIHGLFLLTTAYSARPPKGTVLQIWRSPAFLM